MYTKQELFEIYEKKLGMSDVAKKGREAKKNNPKQSGYSWTPSVFGGVDGKENRMKLKNSKIRQNKRANLKTK